MRLELILCALLLGIRLSAPKTRGECGVENRPSWPVHSFRATFVPSDTQLQNSDCANTLKMGWFSNSSNDNNNNTLSDASTSQERTQAPLQHSSLPLPNDTTTPLKPSIPKTTITKRNSDSSNGQRDASKPDDWLPLMTSKQVSKYTDPCAHAAKASTKCMEENGYDRSLCMKQFQDYRDCKKTWVLKRRSDRLAGREGSFD